MEAEDGPAEDAAGEGEEAEGEAETGDEQAPERKREEEQEKERDSTEGEEEEDEVEEFSSGADELGDAEGEGDEGDAELSSEEDTFRKVDEESTPNTRGSTASRQNSNNQRGVIIGRHRRVQSTYDRGLQGPMALKRGMFWRTRYLRVTPTMLHVFKDQSKSLEGRIEISLEGARVVAVGATEARIKDIQKYHRFQVTTLSGHVYMFGAGTELYKNEWIEVLERMIEDLSGEAATLAPNRDISHADGVVVSCDLFHESTTFGFLYCVHCGVRRSQHFKAESVGLEPIETAHQGAVALLSANRRTIRTSDDSAKKRFLRLRGHVLVWARDNKMTEVEGRLNLDLRCRLVRFDTNARDIKYVTGQRFVFTVTNPDGSFSFGAPSETEREVWLMKLVEVLTRVHDLQEVRIQHQREEIQELEQSGQASLQKIMYQKQVLQILDERARAAPSIFDETDSRISRLDRLVDRLHNASTDELVKLLENDNVVRKLCNTLRRIGMSEQLNAVEEQVLNNVLVCFRVIMNSALGMEIVVQDEEPVLLMSRSVLCRNRVDSKLVVALCEMLAATALFSQDGCEVASRTLRSMDAEFQNRMLEEPHLVEVFAEASLFEDIPELQPYKAIIQQLDNVTARGSEILAFLGLINVIVSAPRSRHARLRIRADLRRAGIHEVLESLSARAKIVLQDANMSADVNDIMPGRPSRVHQTENDDLLAALKGGFDMRLNKSDFGGVEAAAGGGAGHADKGHRRRGTRGREHGSLDVVLSKRIRDTRGAQGEALHTAVHSTFTDAAAASAGYDADDASARPSSAGNRRNSLRAPGTGGSRRAMQPRSTSPPRLSERLARKFSTNKLDAQERQQQQQRNRALSVTSPGGAADVSVVSRVRGKARTGAAGAGNPGTQGGLELDRSRSDSTQSSTARKRGTSAGGQMTAEEQAAERQRQLEERQRQTVEDEGPDVWMHVLKQIFVYQECEEEEDTDEKAAFNPKNLAHLYFRIDRLALAHTAEVREQCTNVLQQLAEGLDATPNDCQELSVSHIAVDVRVAAHMNASRQHAASVASEARRLAEGRDKAISDAEALAAVAAAASKASHPGQATIDKQTSVTDGPNDGTGGGGAPGANANSDADLEANKTASTADGAAAGGRGRDDKVALSAAIDAEMKAELEGIDDMEDRGTLSAPADASAKQAGDQAKADAAAKGTPAPPAATVPAKAPPLPPALPGAKPPPLPGMGGGPAPPPGPPPPGLLLGRGPQLPADYAGPKPEKRMRALHWERVPNSLAGKTWWSEEAARNEGALLRGVTVDHTRLQTLFDAAARPAGAKPRPPAADKKKTASRRRRRSSVNDGIPEDERLRLLQPSRTQNIEITLRRLNMSAAEVRDKFASCTLHELSDQRLELLELILPSTDEERILGVYIRDGGAVESLRRAERFMTSIQKIPRYRAKFDLARVLKHGEHKVSEVSAQLHNLTNAVQQVEASQALRATLLLVVQVGNFVNYGTQRMVAQSTGVRVSSVEKLLLVKSSDPQYAPTLLHYIVRIAKDAGSPAVNLSAELSSLEGAVGVEHDQVQAQMTEMVTLLRSAQREAGAPDTSVADTHKATIAQLVQSLTELNGRHKRIEDRAHALMELFGEDPRQQSYNDWFGQLVNMCSALDKAIADINKMEEDQRRAEAAEKAKRERQESIRKAKERRAQKQLEDGGDEEGAGVRQSARRGLFMMGNTNRVVSISKGGMVDNLVSDLRNAQAFLRRQQPTPQDDDAGEV